MLFESTAGNYYKQFFFYCLPGLETFILNHSTITAFKKQRPQKMYLLNFFNLAASSILRRFGRGFLTSI